MLLAFGLTCGLLACNEELEFREPYGDNSAVPLKINEISVENLPGKALLTYTVPNDANLLYVEASYELNSGKTRKVKSSYYDNKLLLEGFADTLDHEVKVYAVSRNDIYSEATTVNVKPKKAPIWEIYESLKINNAFGGYDLKADNPLSEDISILVLKKNDFGEFEVDNQKSVFTSLPDIESKIRGLDTVNYEFKIAVRDKWGNTTDTLNQTILPLFETELDRSKFGAFDLPGDAPQLNSTRIEFLWDGRYGWPFTSFTKKAFGVGQPHIITFDTGVEAKVSRIWMRPFPELNPPQFYYLTTLKRFEIYGSADPSLNGELDDSWFLLGSYEIEKPSGSPYGQDTNEDREVARAGFNFEVDLDAPKVRYIRIRCLENWAGGTNQSIADLRAYGDPR